MSDYVGKLRKVDPGAYTTTMADYYDKVQEDKLTWNDVLSSSESEDEALRVPSKAERKLYTDACDNTYCKPSRTTEWQ